MPRLGFALLLAWSVTAHAATTIPTDVEQPGTQPLEVSGLESATRCDNCHGGYNPGHEPAHGWRGSAMAHAGRDPLFWATVAIAEQDFDGAGDLCLRCHSPEGWLAGRSTPTDGSGLADGSDRDGVTCDLCHTMVNPDDSEHVGEQFAPYLAHDGGTAHIGSGQYVLWGGSDKLGPYSDAEARHQFMQSSFHRSPEFCGTCHDVSNPVTGDLAPFNGAQEPLLSGEFSGIPGDAVEYKAAFNSFPYQHGVVERTWSEHMASALPTTPVSDFGSLPAELQDGAIAFAYNSALAAGTGGDYADGTQRTFTCQSCHMPPVSGHGANKRGLPLRGDLPMHDLTGGNAWIADAIMYLDRNGWLLFGGGLTVDERAALIDGQARARSMLSVAASLSVSGDLLTVTNLTGHKLISGYPEGRRMWLNVRWYDGTGALLREDGEYGQLDVWIDGVPDISETILDLDDPETVIYEAHYAISQEWAAELLALGYDPTLPLSYDRVDGTVTMTLGELAVEAPGSYHDSFHFVLNDTVSFDNRIPPYGMDFDEAAARNALPVPATRFGDPGSGGIYDHHDEILLNPPSGATFAEIDLLYQATSWEYVQFLYLANDGASAFMADEGLNLLDAWQNTGMAAPELMASTTWGVPSTSTCETSELACDDGLDDDCDGDVDCADTDCGTDAACTTSAACDGDGVCEPGETCESCASDCAGRLGGKKTDRYCCGDGVLQGAEGGGSVCDGNP
jgi:hypothetical protein